MDTIYDASLVFKGMGECTAVLVRLGGGEDSCCRMARCDLSTSALLTRLLLSRRVSAERRGPQREHQRPLDVSVHVPQLLLSAQPEDLGALRRRLSVSLRHETEAGELADPGNQKRLEL